jgi:hypothetical protein
MAQLAQESEAGRIAGQADSEESHVRHQGNDARDDNRRDVAFLDERMQVVEREIKQRCASLMEAYPEAGARVREECQRPFGEEEPIEGLLLAADATLLRFKRERHLLEWLREMVVRFPLSRLLLKGPGVLMSKCECLEQETSEARTYSEEYWELRQSAETLRFLWGRWSEWTQEPEDREPLDNRQPSQNR